MSLGQWDFFHTLKVSAKAINKVADNSICGFNDFVPIIYGKQLIIPKIIAIGKNGNNLVLCGVIGLGEINSYVTDYLNNDTVPSGVTITHYVGTTTQTVDSTLASAISGYADDLVVTINGTEYGIAYCVYEITPTAIHGWPRFSHIVEGRKDIYDPRTSTTAYSRNPALQLANFAASSDYGAGKTMDWSGSIAAFNWCDDRDMIGAVSFGGAGLNDLTTSGTFSGTAEDNFKIEIDGVVTGSISSITDYSATVADTVKVTSAAHGRSTGQSVKQSGTTNYNGTYSVTVIDVDNYYISASYAIDETTGTWELSPNTFKWSADGGTTWTATGVGITGVAQTLADGVTVTFAALTGHTVDSYWTFVAGQARKEGNLLLDAPASCESWLEVMKQYAGCFIRESGGTVTLVPDKPVTVFSSLGSSGILEGSIQFSESEKSKIPNAVDIVYTDTSAVPWRTNTASVETTAVAAGTEQILKTVLRLPGIQNYAQAVRDATERLQWYQLCNLKIICVCFDEAIDYVEGDGIAITHPIGFSALNCQVTKISSTATGRWRIEMQKYINVFDNSLPAAVVLPNYIED